MKVAIASKGNTLDHHIDVQFGHCAFFVIFDNDSNELQIRSNPFKDTTDQAGIRAVKWLAAEGVKSLIAGDFGPKIQPLLDQMRMQLIVIRKPETSIQQLINLLKPKHHAKA